MVDPGITIRRATDADLEAVIDVGASALGWKRDEPNEALFRWKHLDNVFGRSPIWLAEIDGRIAGYRALMHWRLTDASGGSLTAVRAVDTATHPDFQRRGIFSALTRHGIDQAKHDGVDLVFNTPNDQSRPGYLKMGWIEVGRLPVALRPTSLSALIRLLSARTPAQKWSEASTTGESATQVLNDVALFELIESQPASVGLATELSTDFLRWRYSLEPLRYRAWSPSGLADGVVLFRVRQRGAARECAVGHVLTPSADSTRARELLRGLCKAVDADYVLRLGRDSRGNGFLPMPGQGPRLTARALNVEPPDQIRAWDFKLGDIELF